MAKTQDNSGCAALLIIGILCFAVSQCSSSEQAPGPSASSNAATDPTDEPDAVAMFVTAKRVACRDQPSTRGDKVTGASLGDEVLTLEASGSWTKVAINATEPCWIATRFLSEDRPEPELEQAVSEPPAPIRSLLSTPEPSTAQCGAKWKCGQMDSCAEANHYLNDCGVSRLDGDGDGVPCESIC